MGGQNCNTLPDTPITITPPAGAKSETQDVHDGSQACPSCRITNDLPVTFLWYYDSTNLVSEAATNGNLKLTHVQASQSGAYTVPCSIMQKTLSVSWMDMSAISRYIGTAR